MRCRVDIHTAQSRTAKPWRLIGYNLGIYHLGDVSVDSIEGKCRCILILTCNGTVWNKSELDQCLEAVTDTKCETISLIQKPHNSFLHSLVLEGCREELSRTIRLITCGESSREHDNLRLVNGLHICLEGLSYLLCCLILEYNSTNIRSRSFKSLSRIVFTVGTREYRDKYIGLSNLILTDIDISFGIKEWHLYRFASLICLIGEYLTKRLAPRSYCFINSNLCTTYSYYSIISYSTDKFIVYSDLTDSVSVNLNKDVTHCPCEEILKVTIIIKLNTKLISECHLAYSRSHTVLVKCIG